MKFCVAGYYLVQGSSKPDWMDKKNIMPDKIWSGSRHICPKLPDAWIFDWVTENTLGQERDRAIEKLQFSPAEFSAMQKDFQDLFKNDQFGFPNVFMNSNIALEMYYKYFHKVPDLKLLGLGLPETALDLFFEEYEKPGFELVSNNGVYRKLEQEQAVNANVLEIGYDLLCFTAADYCSFLCGSMESEIQDKYGVQYNQYGWVSEYKPADRVVQAIRRGEEQAEEGFWASWLAFEIALQ